MKILELYLKGKKVGEVDVTGWTVAEVVAVMRVARPSFLLNKVLKFSLEHPAFFFHFFFPAITVNPFFS